jgi:hypothetical protein
MDPFGEKNLETARTFLERAESQLGQVVGVRLESHEIQPIPPPITDLNPIRDGDPQEPARYEGGTISPQILVVVVELRVLNENRPCSKDSEEARRSSSGKARPGSTWQNENRARSGIGGLKSCHFFR